MKTAEKNQPTPKTIRSGNGRSRIARAGNGIQKTVNKTFARKLVVEMQGDEPYRYFPLGDYIVSAPEVCRGRPTFKYTRVEVAPILEAMANGWTVETVVQFYQRAEVSEAAVREAMYVAAKAVEQLSYFGTTAS